VKRFEHIIGGQPVFAMAEPSQAALVDDVWALAGQLAQCEPLRPGMRLRIGWTMLTAERDGDGLMLCEPDFDGDPLTQTRPRIDVSLDVMAQQAAFAHARQVEPLDTRFDQILIVGRGALARPDIQAFRDPPDGTDSGWSVTELGTEPSEDPDAFETLAVHRLLRLRPALLSLLILPPGYGLILEAGKAPLVLSPDAAGQ